MPFTFSHPAAILPINHFFKRRLSTTGLVAGSLVPDFEYFVRAYHQTYYTHTWAGLFYIDVPAGVALCFLYHAFIRKPFYANAPLFLKRKLARFQSIRWSSWAIKNWKPLLLSVLLGAFTHLLWDNLTHHSVPLVQSASGFRRFASPDDKEMTYYFFWDISSLIGLFFVLYAIWTLPSDKSIMATKGTRRYWLCFAGSATTLFLIQLLFINAQIIDSIAIAVINSILLGLLFTSVFFSYRIGKKDLA